MFMENVFGYFSIALIKSRNHDTSQNERFIWGLWVQNGRISGPNIARTYSSSHCVWWQDMQETERANSRCWKYLGFQNFSP